MLEEGWDWRDSKKLREKSLAKGVFWKSLGKTSSFEWTKAKPNRQILNFNLKHILAGRRLMRHMKQQRDIKRTYLPNHIVYFCCCLLLPYIASHCIVSRCESWLFHQTIRNQCGVKQSHLEQLDEGAACVCVCTCVWDEAIRFYFCLNLFIAFSCVCLNWLTLINRIQWPPPGARWIGRWKLSRIEHLIEGKCDFIQSVNWDGRERVVRS